MSVMGEQLHGTPYAVPDIAIILIPRISHNGSLLNLHFVVDRIDLVVFFGAVKATLFLSDALFDVEVWKTTKCSSCLRFPFGKLAMSWVFSHQ
jgi:hypothetical protein